MSTWENEGGALARDDMSHYFGRRVEPDKSWTVYHVFSGAPAELEGWSMAGLGETEATSTMIFLNAMPGDAELRASGRSSRRGSDRRLPITALTFPNRSRSYDEAGQRIRFIGHDGMFEIAFAVETDDASQSCSGSGLGANDSVCCPAVVGFACCRFTIW